MRNLIELIEKEVLLKKGIYRCEIIQKQANHKDTFVVFVLGTYEVKCSELEVQLSREYDKTIKVVQLTSFPINQNGEVMKADLKKLPVFNRNIGVELKKKYPFLEIEMNRKESFQARKSIPLHPVKEAISYGPEFTDKTLVTTLTQALHDASIKSSTKRINVIDAKGVKTAISYSDLYAKSLSIARRFSSKKSEKQIPLIIQMPDVHEYLEVFWGSLSCNIPSIPFAIPKKYETSDPLAKKMIQTIEQFEEVLIVCESNRKSDIEGLLYSVEANNTTIITYEELKESEGDNEFEAPKLEDIALYLMTSGSTGAPKLVPQTHERIMLRSLSTIDANSMTQDDVSLNWLPLDHVGGLVMFHIRDVVSKCEQYQVNTRYILEKPIRWLELCDKHQVNLTWAPNFAFNLINSFEKSISSTDLDLSSLRFIMNSGEQIIASQVIKFLKILKPKKLSDHCIFPAWGMSETCSAVFFNSNFSSKSNHDRYVSVGKPIMGIDTRIVDDQNKVVKEGIHGRLQVRGVCILEEYYNRPDVNKVSFTNDHWFDTGDIAFINNESVAIVGRNKDILIINGQNLSCHEIEEYIDTIAGVERSYTAVVPFRKNDSATDSAVVFIHTKYEDEELKSLTKQIRRDISKSFGFNPDKILCVAKEKIPKTSIGKIQKGKLTKALEEGDFGSFARTNPEQGDTNIIELPSVMQRTWEISKLEELHHIENENSEVLHFSTGNSVISFSDSDDSLIKVDFKDKYEKISSNHFTIKKGTEDQIYQLLKQLTEERNVGVVVLEGLLDTQTLHSPIHTQELSIYLLGLVKAIKKTFSRNITILYVSQLGQKVFDSEKIQLDISPQIALLRSIDDEFRKVHFKFIDVDDEIDGSQLLSEVNNANLFEKEIAYRNGKRYTTKLQDANISSSTNSFFEKDKLYAIVGGLGGIALSLTAYLLENGITNILLVGRTKYDDLSINQKQKLTHLQSVSSNVHYISLDISEHENCIELIEQSEHLYGRKIEAILNLAAFYLPKEILYTEEDDIKNHYSAKILGSWNLYNLCKDYKIASLINFSSVNGFFGGTGAGPYAAANRYQDALSYFAQDEKSVDVITIAWSMWENIGLSESINFIELTTRKGFNVLSPSDGFNALEGVLASTSKNVIVGINPTNLNMHPYLFLQSENLLEVNVVSMNPMEIDEVNELLKDDYGTVIPISSLKHSENNENMSSDFDEQLNSNGIQNYVQDIFKELLHLDEFDISEDFFELGGSSLIIPQLYNRILEEFNVEIEMDDLFERGTVMELSEVINEKMAINNV